MSSQQNRSEQGSQRSGNRTDNYNQEYTVTGRGTNSQGNKYDNRDYGKEAPNQNPYHYSNKDGSYYYDNANNSKYYNDGQGKSWYEPANAGGNRYYNDGNGYREGGNSRGGQR